MTYPNDFKKSLKKFGIIKYFLDSWIMTHEV